MCRACPGIPKEAPNAASALPRLGPFLPAIYPQRKLPVYKKIAWLNAIASKPKHNSTRLAAVNARNPSDTKSRYAWYTCRYGCRPEFIKDFGIGFLRGVQKWPTGHRCCISHVCRAIKTRATKRSIAFLAAEARPLEHSRIFSVTVRSRQRPGHA